MFLLIYFSCQEILLHLFSQWPLQLSSAICKITVEESVDITDGVFIYISKDAS